MQIRGPTKWIIFLVALVLLPGLTSAENTDPSSSMVDAFDDDFHEVEDEQSTRTPGNNLNQPEEIKREPFNYTLPNDTFLLESLDIHQDTCKENLQKFGQELGNLKALSINHAGGN